MKDTNTIRPILEELLLCLQAVIIVLSIISCAPAASCELKLSFGNTVNALENSLDVECRSGK